MEQIKELEEVLELLNTKQYTKLRQYLAELNDADIAGLLEELEEEEMLKVFRILPKDLAADVFSYLDMDNQQKIITSLSDKEATNIINNLMADDAADLLEEMPANIVKKLLTNASPDVRRDINHLLRYPEDSAGSIMTVEYVDLKENLTVNQAIERIRKVGLDSETINICYVLDAQRRLVGTVALRYLLLMDSTLAFRASRRTRLSIFISLSSAESSIVMTRSPPGMYEDSALRNVVLPDPVPPLIKMLYLALTISLRNLAPSLEIL